MTHEPSPESVRTVGVTWNHGGSGVDADGKAAVASAAVAVNGYRELSLKQLHVRSRKCCLTILYIRGSCSRYERRVVDGILRCGDRMQTMHLSGFLLLSPFLSIVLEHACGCSVLPSAMLRLHLHSFLFFPIAWCPPLQFAPSVHHPFPHATLYFMHAGLDRFCVRLEREVRPPFRHPAPTEPNHGQTPGRFPGAQVMYFLSYRSIFLYFPVSQPAASAGRAFPLYLIPEEATARLKAVCLVT